MKFTNRKADIGLLSLYIAYSSCSVFGYWKSARECVLDLATSVWERLYLPSWISFYSIAVVFLLASLLIIDYYFELWCDQRPIHGIPSIPGGLPIAGNLFQQGPSAAMTYWNWGPDVFQLRLGTKRVVVANTHQSIYHLWQTNLKANISRPVLYTFHKVMSTSQGTTVGTTPYSESWKRMRKSIAANLNLAAIKSYAPIIDRQSAKCIENLESTTSEDIDVHSVFSTFTLCIVSIQLCSKKGY